MLTHSCPCLLGALYSVDNAVLSLKSSSLNVICVQVADLQGSAAEVQRLALRVDSAESAAAAAKARLDQRLDTLRGAVEAMQAKVLDSIADSSAQRDAAAAALDKRVRGAECQLTELSERAHESAKAMDKDVERLDAIVTTCARAVFGSAEAPAQQQHLGQSLVAQVADVTAAVRGKCNAAAVDDIKQLSLQVGHVLLFPCAGWLACSCVCVASLSFTEWPLVRRRPCLTLTIVRLSTNP